MLRDSDFERFFEDFTTLRHPFHFLTCCEFGNENEEICTL